MNQLICCPTGTIERQHRCDDVLLASQPQPADLEAACEKGVRTVVNLRLPEELAEFDEAAMVTALGMEYQDLGFDGPVGLTDEILERTRTLLNTPSKRPLLLHCASANRVGAVWLAHRVLDHDVPYADALAEARTIGLRTGGYEKRAREYVEQQSGEIH